MDRDKTGEATQAPEGINRSQQEDGQVVDAADMLRSQPDLPSGESRHGRPNDPADVIADDVPDLIDRMEEMVQSGHIDEDAYDGEPIHDDAEGPFGDREESLNGDAPLP